MSNDHSKSYLARRCGDKERDDLRGRPPLCKTKKVMELSQINDKTIFVQLEFDNNGHSERINSIITATVSVKASHC